MIPIFTVLYFLDFTDTHLIGISIYITLKSNNRSILSFLMTGMENDSSLKWGDSIECFFSEKSTPCMILHTV